MGEQMILGLILGAYGAATYIAGWHMFNVGGLNEGIFNKVMWVLSPITVPFWVLLLFLVG